MKPRAVVQLYEHISNPKSNLKKIYTIFENVWLSNVADFLNH